MLSMLGKHRRFFYYIKQVLIFCADSLQKGLFACSVILAKTKANAIKVKVTKYRTGSMLMQLREN